MSNFTYQVQDILNRCFDAQNNRLLCVPSLPDNVTMPIGTDGGEGTLSSNGTDVVLALTSAATLEVRGVASGVLVAERTPATPTDTVYGGTTVRSVKSSDMGDGFGSAINFEIEDNAGVENAIGTVGAVRNGADNTGKLLFATHSTGSFGVRAYLTASTLDFQQATTITTTAGNLTLTPTGDLVLKNGKNFIGDTANVNMTAGLTINQGAADDEILAGKSSDVAHGMTTDAETDTYFSVSKIGATQGGAKLLGLAATGVSEAIRLQGYATDDNTAKTTAARGKVRLLTGKKSGTTAGADGADANLVSIDSFGTTRFLFDAEGSGHADVEWTTYDTHNDLALITDMEHELLLREDEAKTDRRHMLERAGIIGRGSWHMENGRPRAMVNFTRLAMLHHGALMQVGEALNAIAGVLTPEQKAALPEVVQRRLALTGGA